MDLKSILCRLREERDALEVAIASLERLDNQQRRGPGRPPGSVTKVSTNGTNHVNGSPDPAANKQ
jgi:hypothetical protein